MASRILVALDGEPHTETALDWALRLADQLGLGLTGVHVRDPYLKQFENYLYAQGRQEYVAHVEDCLVDLGEQIIAAFRDTVAQAAAAGAVGADLDIDDKVLDGDPFEQLTNEVASGDYDLLVLGRKRLAGFAAWRSGKLTERLTEAVNTLPVLAVPESVPESVPE